MPSLTDPDLYKPPQRVRCHSISHFIYIIYYIYIFLLFCKLKYFYMNDSKRHQSLPEYVLMTRLSQFHRNINKNENVANTVKLRFIDFVIYQMMH